MAADLLLNLAWVVLLSLLGLALPASIAALAARAGGAREHEGEGRLLLAGLLALLISLACGFSLQYGAVYLPQLGEQPGPAWQWAPFGEGSGLLAWAGPGLPGVEPGRMALFLLQAVSTATVVLLALAPLHWRLPGPGLAAAAILVGGALYPLPGHWTWGRGWLAGTGRTAYLGHGFVDFGAGVHYTLGGLLALAGLLATRADHQEADEGRPGLRAALLALLGMAALHGASTWGVSLRVGLVVANTLVSAAAAGLTATVYMAFTTTRVRPEALARGLLAGAAASGGLAPFAHPATLLLVGAVAGLIACLGSYLVERVWQLDDPAGVVPSFGFAGAWGVVATGLFADGTFGQGLNGVGAGSYLGVAGQGVSGIALLAPGIVPDYAQLAAQVLGLAVILSWALGVGGLLFRLATIHPPEKARPRGRRER